MVLRILEVGPGGNKRYGFQPRAPHYPWAEYYYCDIEPNPDIGVEYCNLEERLPYPSDYFDYVYLSHVLEHLRDPLHGLGEVRRVLKPGGKAFICVPNMFSDNAWRDPDHKQFFNIITLWRTVKRVGLRPHLTDMQRSVLKAPIGWYFSVLIALLAKEICVWGEKPRA